MSGRPMPHGSAILYAVLVSVALWAAIAAVYVWCWS